MSKKFCSVCREEFGREKYSVVTLGNADKIYHMCAWCFTDMAVQLTLKDFGVYNNKTYKEVIKGVISQVRTGACFEDQPKVKSTDD